MNVYCDFQTLNTKTKIDNELHNSDVLFPIPNK